MTAELGLGAWLGGAVCYLAVLTAPTAGGRRIPLPWALVFSCCWPVCLAAQRAFGVPQ